MKPINLQMTGFLSYRDTAELSFEQFDLACISGNNGAGKSSILDAMTFALFGKARKNDSSLINSASEKGEVIFVFEYEGDKYRIIRRLYKTKPFELEFQIFDDLAQIYQPISESSRTRTENTIQQRLGGLDYETFTNASFFLQGEADSFTQKKPTERKEILGKILGLEKWDVYKDKTTKIKREKETLYKQEEAAIKEIDAYLMTEPQITQSITSIKDELKSLQKQKATIQTNIDLFQHNIEQHERQKKNCADQRILVQQDEQEFQDVLAEIALLETDKSPLFALASKKESIEENYRAWKQNELLLDQLTATYEKYQKLDREKQAILSSIEIKKQVLTAKLDNLFVKQNEINQMSEKLPGQMEELNNLCKQIEELNKLQGDKHHLQGNKDLAISLNNAFSELSRLHQDMNHAKSVLESSINALQSQKTSLEKELSKIPVLELELSKNKTEAEQFEKRIKAAKTRDDSVAEQYQQIEIIKLKVNLGKKELAAITDRKQHLVTTHSAHCSYCEQPLSESEKDALIAKLDREEESKQDDLNKFENEILAKELAISLLEKISDQPATLQQQKETLVASMARLESELSAINLKKLDWEENNAQQLSISLADLEKGDFSLTYQSEIDLLKQTILPVLDQLGINREYSSLKAIKDEVEAFVSKVNSQINELADVEDKRNSITAQVSVLQQKIDQTKTDVSSWQKNGSVELRKNQEQLKVESYALEEKENQNSIQQQIDALDFDLNGYAQLVESVRANRSSADDYSDLVSAIGKLTQIDRQLNDKQTNRSKIETRKNNNLLRYDEMNQALVSFSDHSKDLENSLQERTDLTTRETTKNQELGAEQEKLSRIEQQKVRKAAIEKGRVELASDIKHLSTLETAFGKNGIPALLIEQAIPNIEDKANELLGRLTNDTMSIHINTQEAYADKNRADLKETLNIHISDGSEYKDYEMYSGGEAFRVNFAIRLALSEVLTSRSGAKLQTLVIDEGFGSQDTEGREKLKQCINVIKNDFAKILIITHLDDLKEAFPNRIEIEKSHGTSLISVY